MSTSSTSVNANIATITTSSFPLHAPTPGCAPLPPLPPPWPPYPPTQAHASQPGLVTSGGVVQSLNARP